MATCSIHPGSLLPGCTYCRTGTEPLPNVKRVASYGDALDKATELRAVLASKVPYGQKQEAAHALAELYVSGGHAGDVDKLTFLIEQLTTDLFWAMP
jgi:hypothetical protein